MELRVDRNFPDQSDGPTLVMFAETEEELSTLQAIAAFVACCLPDVVVRVTEPTAMLGDSSSMRLPTETARRLRSALGDADRTFDAEFVTSYKRVYDYLCACLWTRDPAVRDCEPVETVALSSLVREAGMLEAPHDPATPSVMTPLVG